MGHLYIFDSYNRCWLAGKEPTCLVPFLKVGRSPIRKESSFMICYCLLPPKWVVLVVLPKGAFWSGNYKVAVWRTNSHRSLRLGKPMDGYSVRCHQKTKAYLLAGSTRRRLCIKGSKIFRVRFTTAWLYTINPVGEGNSFRPGHVDEKGGRVKDHPRYQRTTRKQ